MNNLDSGVNDRHHEKHNVSSKTARDRSLSPCSHDKRATLNSNRTYPIDETRIYGLETKLKEIEAEIFRRYGATTTTNFQQNATNSKIPNITKSTNNFQNQVDDRSCQNNIFGKTFPHRIPSGPPRFDYLAGPHLSNPNNLSHFHTWNNFGMNRMPDAHNIPQNRIPFVDHNVQIPNLSNRGTDAHNIPTIVCHLLLIIIKIKIRNHLRVLSMTIIFMVQGEFRRISGK